MSLPVTNDAAATRCCGGNALTWIALLVAIAGLFGTIWLSLGMKLIPCPLCYYQRTFLMGAFAVLAAGRLTPARHSPFVGLLALPLAAGGLCVAARHVYLESMGLLECPPGWLTSELGLDRIYVGSAPQQSLALLAVLFVVLAADVLTRRRELGLCALLGAVAVGGALGASAIVTVSPPDIPKAPAPLVGCRKPAA